MKKKDNSVRAGCKDMWNAFMCREAVFSDKDIPYCPTIMTDLPKQIITWDEALRIYKKEYAKDRHFRVDAYVCFYVDDCRFDGVRRGIWLFPKMSMKVLKHFTGIITPDFSTYQDFPYPIKIYNTYRMRAFGYWAGRLGLEVINNVRWGTKDSYDYCFDGIPKDSVVAIGTVGGSPFHIIDRDRFEEGLLEMMHRLTPHTIVIYGSANYECFKELEKQGVEIVSYQGQTSAAFERRKNQNE